MKPPGRRRQVGTPIMGALRVVVVWLVRVGREGVVRGWEGVVRRRVRRGMVRGRCMVGGFFWRRERWELKELWESME